ncbi:hypothetical protein AAGV28_07235 [Flavobacterium sp. FZUC8N2.13]|uniref:Antirepressor protein ant N-terminal domain-containing protein n=1 Tax=Flavobacterium zubiriense TaxID=3138075 RepID=A0ABV4TE14_9FLAO
MSNISIGKINNQEIQVIDLFGIEYIYLKPICSALGVSYTKEVFEVMENDFVSDKHKLLPIVIDEKETDSIAIPIKYMLGYIAVISKKTFLSKDDYLKNKRKILDAMYEYLFPHYKE